MRLNAGLVFLADSRTNAGVDQVSTTRKLTVYERSGQRMLCLLSAGNLAVSQAVRQILQDMRNEAGESIWTVPTVYAAAELVGQAVRQVHDHDAEAMKKFSVDFSASFILGGQIGGQPSRLFQIYAAGNFIEANDDNVYFQIGESKYGKPILDRVINARTSLDEAAKCALISMDSTLRSNISVGLPLDLLVYETDALTVTRFARIDDKNQYFQMIRNTWGLRLKQVFSEISDPDWIDNADIPAHVERAAPLRVISPDSSIDPVASQTLAQQV
jgi:putative proteasome-type protease